MPSKKKKAEKAGIAMERLIFGVSIVSFIVVYFVNEKVIFEKFFSGPSHRAVAAVQKLNSDKELNSADLGFQELTKFFADPHFGSGAVAKIKIMGEEIALAAPVNISKHTYWLFDKDDKKIGEEIVGDSVLAQKITETYYNKPFNRISSVKQILQYFLAVEILILTGIKLFLVRKD